MCLCVGKMTNTMHKCIQVLKQFCGTLRIHQCEDALIQKIHTYIQKVALKRAFKRPKGQSSNMAGEPVGELSKTQDCRAFRQVSPSSRPGNSRLEWQLS